MDLKTVIETVCTLAGEAHNAYHAGHHDVAHGHLGEVRMIIEALGEMPAQPASDVTESATIEKPAQAQGEKPAQVFDGPANPEALDSASQPETQKAVPGATSPTGAAVPTQPLGENTGHVTQPKQTQ